MDSQLSGLGCMGRWSQARVRWIVSLGVTLATASPLACATATSNLRSLRDSTGRDVPELSDLETIDKLGFEILRYDTLAWWASDVLESRITERSVPPTAGWVVEDASLQGGVVIFFDHRFSGVAAVSCSFAGPQSCTLEWLDGDLEGDTRKAALVTVEAMHHKKSRDLRWPVNTVTVPARPFIGRDGWLVYVLSATTTHAEIVLGPHRRFVYGPGGRLVGQRLLTRPMILSATDLPNESGSTSVGMAVTHGLDKTPVETHLFAALAHGMWLTVSTIDGSLYSVGPKDARLSPSP